MKKFNRIIPYFVLVIAIVFFVYGIYKNEPQEIFQKAILICLECIGIG